MRHSAARRAALSAMVSAASLAAAASPAAALVPPVSSVIAFGDSYADNGNLFRIIGVQPPPIPYQTGRFSGGTNFVDTLSTYYGVPQVNYAIGGAQTGLTNVTGAGVPGFAFEYNGAFAASPVNGYTGLLPGATFKSTDIIALSIGGNDARGYELSGGSMAGVSAAAAVSAAQATTGINVLLARGAKTIVFLAGDVGRLPEVIGNPQAAVGSAYSAAYNASIQSTFAQAAAGGTRVVYVDLNKVADQVKANPAAYGFTNVVNSCPVPQCIATPDLQNQYLFYVDGVHLTSAGFAVVGRYAINQLQAPYTFRASADLPRRAALAFGESLNGRLDDARGRADVAGADAAKPFGLFLQFTGMNGHRDGDAGGLGYSWHSTGVTGGAEYARDGLVLGGAFSYSRPRTDKIAEVDTRAKSYQVGGYAGFAMAGFFAQGYAAYGWHDMTISRTGVITPLVADPKAKTWAAGGRAGWLLGFGPARIGPVVGLDYAHARLPGYTEAGDSAASLSVSRQTSEAVLGSLGAELRGSFEGGRVTPWLRATAERDLKGDGRIVDYAATATPTIVNSFFIPGDRKQTYGALAGGLSAELIAGVALDLNVKASFGRDEGHDASGFAGVRVAF